MANEINRIAKASIEIDANITPASEKIDATISSVESIGTAADEATSIAQRGIDETSSALDVLLAKLNQVKTQTADVTSFAEASWGKARTSASNYLAEFKTTDFRKVTQEIKAELESVGVTGDISGRRLTGAINQAGDAFRENTEKIAAFQSRLTASLGVITGITGAVGLAAAGFVKFGRSMLEAAKEAGRVRDAIADLRDQIDRIDPSSAVSGMSDLHEVYEATRKAILDQNLGLEETMRLHDRLDESMQKARDSAREIRYDSAIETGKEAVQTLAAIRDGARENLSLTPELDAAYQKYRDTIKEVNEQVQILNKSTATLFGSGREAEANELIAQRVRLLKEAQQAASDELDLRLTKIAEEEQLRAKAQDDRIRAEREAMQAIEAEKDRRSQERVQREIEQLRQGLESITSGEFTTVLQSIPKILQEVSSRLGRLK